MTDRDTRTVEELEQSLAHMLAHSREEVLSYAEVQIFMQLREEILRRRAQSANAAYSSPLGAT